MVSTDSCLAGSMKLQGFTTNTSAWSGCGVNSCPRDTSWPIITSLSTRFLGQPKLTNPIFKVDFREDLLFRGYHAPACRAGCQPAGRLSIGLSGLPQSAPP